MATTGLWPVKSSLKNVLDYAGNPDKTIARKYLDDELANVIEYAVDNDKTDERMYVTGINCIAPLAYETMMSTKKHYGKENGNVAYHGFQSFMAGGVTPEEAHEIGLETARKLWGDEYEVLVTTHLNSENCHNHFVLNSVSFKTGKKFLNKIADHRRMREVSDEVCREYGKSVLENAPFSKSNKKEYWIHKAGKLTRRDILRQDIDYAIKTTTNMREFDSVLKSMGYRYARTSDYKRPSIIADGWKRAVRFDSLGEKYSYEKIVERVQANDQPYYVYNTAYRRHKVRLSDEIKRSMERADYMDGVQVALELLVTLLKFVAGTEIQHEHPRPLSPDVRAACVFLDKYTAQLNLSQKYDLKTEEDVSRFIVEKNDEMQELYSERKKVDNQLRRCTGLDERDSLKNRRSEISEKLKPIRKELATAKDILISMPTVIELLRKEDVREMELAARGRGRSR